MMTRKTDSDYRYGKEIHEMAVTGKSAIEAMGTRTKIWEPPTRLRSRSARGQNQGWGTSARRDDFAKAIAMGQLPLLLLLQSWWLLPASNNGSVAPECVR